MLNKFPPFEKMYEAYSAIADGRVEMHEDYAHINSSDCSKTYEVSWKDNTYASTDNATYWQGYPGYPILAVLLLQKKLPYDQKAIEKMRGIPWKKLNDDHKRDYTAAAEEALEELKQKGVDTSGIHEAACRDNEALKELDIVVKRGRKMHK